MSRIDPFEGGFPGDNPCNDPRVPLLIALSRARSVFVASTMVVHPDRSEIKMRRSGCEWFVPFAGFHHRDPASVVSPKDRCEYILAWCRYWLEQYLHKPVERATLRDYMRLPTAVFGRVCRVYACSLN